MAAQTTLSRRRRSSVAFEDTIARTTSLTGLPKCDGVVRFDKIVKTLLNGVSDSRKALIFCCEKKYVISFDRFEEDFFRRNGKNEE